MAKALIEVVCPCCQTVLKIDAETRAVIAHKVPEKPPVIEDLAAAVAKLKGEPGRREGAESGHTITLYSKVATNQSTGFLFRPNHPGNTTFIINTTSLCTFCRQRL